MRHYGDYGSVNGMLIPEFSRGQDVMQSQPIVRVMRDPGNKTVSNGFNLMCLKGHLKCVGFIKFQFIVIWVLITGVDNGRLNGDAVDGGNKVVKKGAVRLMICLRWWSGVVTGSKARKGKSHGDGLMICCHVFKLVAALVLPGTLGVGGIKMGPVNVNVFVEHANAVVLNGPECTAGSTHRHVIGQYRYCEHAKTIR